jgi:hypothetical protein
VVSRDQAALSFDDCGQEIRDTGSVDHPFRSADDIKRRCLCDAGKS